MARRPNTRRPAPANLDAFDRAGATILSNPLVEEVQDSFAAYAYTVIHSRALPDARDGLKPVHRRILFAAQQMGLRPDRPTVKSAKVVGEVMGNYHPHGDGSIYDAMVRLAQPFTLNAPLIHGQGNFGMAGGEAPAASMRYTEARLTEVAMTMVAGLEEETVDFRPNFDGSTTEPTVLPATFPNLLVNGDAGIAVGMASKMIPHNLGEVIAATRHLLAHPDADLDDLMRFIPGPDLPSGGMLLGLDKVRAAYETGRGVVRLRGTAEITTPTGGRGGSAIVFTALPYGVGSEAVVEAIKVEISQKKRLTGVADINDESDRENETRLVVTCKPGVNPQALLAELYRLTPLETSFGINNNALVGGQPQTLGLKRLLEVFLDHRFDVVRRRTTYRLGRRHTRLHLVQGLLKAMIDIDRVIAIIRSADDVATARDTLMATFDLTDTQATYILDTQLRRLTRYDRLALEAERDRLDTEIAELQPILDDETVLRALVGEELAAIAEEHATPRRTTLIDGDLKEVLAAAVAPGPLEIADDPCQVMLSATGLIARTAAASEESAETRRRNGRVKHDALAAVIPATARGQILLITSRGRAIKTEVLGLPVLPTRAGTVALTGSAPASEFADLTDGEHVITIAPLAAEGLGLALGTAAGTVKIVAPDWPVRAEEFDVITLREGDTVIGGGWVHDPADTLAFVSADASLLQYPAEKVRPQGAKGGGMAGINLADGASAIHFAVVRSTEAAQAAVVTSTGAGIKVTPLSEYPVKGRATGGVRAMRFLKTRGGPAGETALSAAWVGVAPVAVTSTGDPADLPDIDPRRDGSGTALAEPTLLDPIPTPDRFGSTIARD